MPKILGFLIALAGLLAGCASNPLLVGAPPGRSCYVSEDTIAMHAILRGPYTPPEALRSATPDTLLLRVSYDSASAFHGLAISSKTDPRYMLVRPELGDYRGLAAEYPDFDGPELHRQLRSQFVDTAEPESTASVLLTTGPDGALLTNVPLWYCPPVLKNRAEIAAYLEALANALAGPPTQFHEATFCFVVEADGRMAELEILEGTGIPEMDEIFMDIMRASVWDPMIYAGYPFRSDVMMPLAVEILPRKLVPYGD